jgi:hypothetical protein
MCSGKGGLISRGDAGEFFDNSFQKTYQVSDMRQGSPCGWPIACTLNVVKCGNLKSSDCQAQLPVKGIG